jgi:LAO/AO transport system kinase
MARRPWTHEQLVAGVRAGDRRAVARSISLVENRDPGASAVVQELYPETGAAFAIGITGPPGVGKSSLIGALVRHVRALGLSVGVISVDPSSPFTQGALLGDRIRLVDHFLDPGVFIRSMGTRGHLGGLAEATLQSLLLLDASGRDVVFLETVGTGQTEVEVMGIADEVVLVLMPGSGDSVQALKAGIMEIPDVIAINKMDQPGAKALMNDIRTVISLNPGAERQPAIVLTEAVREEGVEGLWSALVERRDRLASAGELEERRRRNLAGEVVSAATARARAGIETAIAEDPMLAELVASVQRRQVDPLTAVDRIVAAVMRDGVA